METGTGLEPAFSYFAGRRDTHSANRSINQDVNLILTSSDTCSYSRRMRKRQEPTYAERLAKMSLKDFIEELFSVLCETVKTGGSARLEPCLEEEKRRGKNAYEKAVSKMNAAFGVRVVSPGELDMRDAAH